MINITMINRFSQVYTVQVEFSKFYEKDYISNSVFIFIMVPIVSLIAIVLIIIFVFKKNRKSDDNSKEKEKENSDKDIEKVEIDDKHRYEDLAFDKDNKQMVTISQIAIQETDQSIDSR